MFLVLLWQRVTVQLALEWFLDIKTDIGVPTILLLPTTTQCLPTVSTFALSSIVITPKGVAGKKLGILFINLPQFIG